MSEINPQHPDIVTVRFTLAGDVWELNSYFPLLRHDMNVSCEPVGISGSWIIAICNSIGDDGKRVFVSP